MRRRTKWFLIVAIGVPTFAVTAFVVVLGLAISGAWPFEPLERRSRQIELANGALIRIEGLEDRGWGSHGYLWTASFRQRDEADFVPIGSWIGPNDDLSVYASGALHRVCQSESPNDPRAWSGWSVEILRPEASGQNRESR